MCVYFKTLLSIVYVKNWAKFRKILRGENHENNLCELRVKNTFLATFNTNFSEFYKLHEFFLDIYLKY